MVSTWVLYFTHHTTGTSSYEDVQSPASSVDARRPAGGAQLSAAGTVYEMVNRDQIKDDDHVYTALKH